MTNNLGVTMLLVLNKNADENEINTIKGKIITFWAL